MQPDPQQADQSEVANFLRVITDGWEEIADEQPQLELRCIGLGGQISVSRFAHNNIEEAAQHAVAMNEHKRNVYACINPIKPDADRKGAKDDDILAAFYCFADADNSDSMRNVTAFAGPKFTMSVRTGTVPYLRGHAYWRLDEPVRNMQAWKAVQKAIAASLKTDETVVNPSRIMRVAGTVSWPPERKRMKGYIPELVTMRTTFSTDRDPVPFERLMRAFPEPERTNAVQDVASGLQIDLGQQAMDRAMAEADIMAGNNWHHNVVRLVASYVSRGLTDGEIHALTDRFTMAGYTTEDTRQEVQTAIDGARAKGYAPTPDPVTERMAAQAVQAADQDKPEQTWPTPVVAFNPGSAAASSLGLRQRLHQVVPDRDSVGRRDRQDQPGTGRGDRHRHRQADLGAASQRADQHLGHQPRRPQSRDEPAPGVADAALQRQPRRPGRQAVHRRGRRHPDHLGGRK
jgi:hypothetical protein